MPGDEVLQRKQKKALEYASERERFTVHVLAFTMRSQHGIRHVTSNPLTGWGCNCPFYLDTLTCSHIMAAQEILQGCTFFVSSPHTDK